MTKLELPLPEELPGIDLEAGLRITQHNENLYRRLLLKFYEKSHGFEQTFRAMLDQGLDQARFEAHSLKGVAGNLGMHGLYELSLALEKVCADNQAALVDQSLADLMRELNTVLSGISSLQTQDEVETHPGTMDLVALDLSALENILNELLPLLVTSDIAAKNVVKKLAPVLNRTELEADFIKLQTAIDGYNFDLAQEIANTIIQAKNVIVPGNPI